MQSHLLKKIENWLLPFYCLLCHNPTTNSTICIACRLALPWLDHACLQCANPLSTDNQLCAPCIQSPPPYERILAVFDYQAPIDHCILSLKFREKLTYAKFLADLMAEKILTHYTTSKLPDCIIPIPLYSKRQQERGYNQALELARPIAKRLHIPLAKYACQRIISTQSQASIPASQRKQNLKNAFKIHPNFHADHVAILDDVVTTGNTVTELALALKHAGIKRIEVWCCARTILRK